MQARWFFYLLLGVFLVTLIAGAFTVVWTDYKATLERRQDEAREAAQAYATHAGRNLGELRFAVDWLAQKIEPQAPDYGLDPATVETAKRLAGHLPGMSAVLFIGADARIKSSTREEAPIGADVSERDYFKAHASGVAEFVGSAIRAKGSRRAVYTLSRRLERNGRFAGLTIASARVEQWSEIIASLVPVPGTLIRLLRPDGSVVVAERRNPFSGQLETILDGTASGPPAASAIVAQVPVGDYGLVADVAVPRQAALASWRARLEPTIIGAVLGLIALSVLGLIGHRLLRREAAALATAAQRTKELEATTAELRKAVETERLLMGELEHRVKNSIMLASGVLSIQKSQVNDRATRAVLDDTQGRILAIARAHDRLHNNAEVSAVAFDGYLRGLCDDLAANAGFRYNVSADAIVVPSSEAVQIGLIVTELLLNAAKHAGMDDVRVEVEAHATTEQLLVTVRDYGDGVPEGFSAAGGSGLGMRIVNNLLFQLDGELDVENVEPGTLFTIRVPLKPPHQKSGADHGQPADMVQ